LGLVLFLWGVWGIVSSILSIGIISTWPLSWITGLVGSVISFAGGSILGWGMIQKKILVKASQDVVEKADVMYKKLVSLQEKIGVLAIIVGLWATLYSLFLQRLLNI
jgi:membrane protein DedA with SNARE-associated domain